MVKYSWRLCGYIQIDSTGNIEQGKTGYLRPSNEKVIPIFESLWANFIPIKLKPGENSTIYARIDHYSKHPLISDPKVLLQPDFAQNKVLKNRSNVYFQQGIFLTICLIVGIYSLIFFIIREN